MKDIVEAMKVDGKHDLSSLLVDGAMTKNNLMMEMQADFLGTTNCIFTGIM